MPGLLKLSAISSAPSNFTTGDQLVGVRGGNTDLLFSPAQVTQYPLSADTTFYVATTGSDSTGAGTAGNPWATLQFAVNWVAANVNLGTGSYHVIIKLADGTYAGNVVLPDYVGTDKGVVFHALTNPGIEIQGNVSTPANVIISTDSTTSNGLAPTGEGYSSGGLTAIDGMWSIRGITFSKTGGNAVKHIASYYSSVVTFDKVAFNTSGAGVAAYAQLGGNLGDDSGGSWSITGAQHTAVWADVNAVVSVAGAITVTGTPAMSQAFLQAFGGQVFWAPASVTGSATGNRFDIRHMGSVTIFSPGSIGGIPGTASSGLLDMRSRLASIPDNLFYGDIPGSVGSGTPTVSSLLPATSVPVGFYAWVADANSTTVGATVAGGGSNKALVVSDGTNWKILAAYA